MRESKDSREAAEDAQDKGMDAYNRGDLEGAARWFREGLEYAPDDRDLRASLNRVEQKIREARQAQEAARQAQEAERQRQLDAARQSEAVRQLTNVNEHSEAARPGDALRARQGIDTANGRGSGLPTTVYAGSSRARDPVVPSSKRTPAITAMERQREDTKKQIKEADDRLKNLDPGKDSVQIAKLKQEKSTAVSKIQYLNFSISEALEKPAPAAAPVSAR